MHANLQGVANTVEAAKQAGGVDRIVLVSSALVTPKNRCGLHAPQRKPQTGLPLVMRGADDGGRWHPIRMLLNNIRWGLMDAKFRGENLLRAGGVPYTVVRPGGLTNDPPGQRELVASELTH